MYDYIANAVDDPSRCLADEAVVEPFRYGGP